MTDNDLKTYATLLKSTVGVKWTNADVQRLYDEVLRLRKLSAVAVPDGFREVMDEKPVALRDVWAGRRP